MIHHFEIDFLDISHDLYEAYTPYKHTKRRLVIADLPYIKWETLQELIELFWYDDILGDFWMESSIRKLLDKIWEYIQKNCCDYIYYNHEWNNIFHQLNPCNVKIISIDEENSLVKLLVTDICMDIWSFITKNKVRISNLTK